MNGRQGGFLTAARRVVMAALVGVAATSCSDGLIEGYTPSESSVAADQTAAETADTSPATTSTTTTTTSTTSTTTTTLPPRPQVAAVETVLASSSPAGVPEWPKDVVVKPGGSVAHMAVNTVVDGRWAASVDTLMKSSVSGSTPLVVDGASDIWVDDLAVSADKVVAVGSTVGADGMARAVYWESPDGVAFGSAAVLPDSVEEALGVALLDGGIPVVVGMAAEPRPTQLVVLRRADDGAWLPTTLVADAAAHWVNGIAASGQTIVVTGGYDRGDRSVGVVWASNDSGATFQEIQDGLDSVESIESPIMTPSGFVAVGDGRGNDPTRLFVSPDGFAWSSVDISLRSLDGRAQTLPRFAGAITALGDDIVFGLGSPLVNVAKIGLDGSGTVITGPDRDAIDVYGSAFPYVIDGSLYLAALSTGGYRLAAELPDGTFIQDAGSATGPIASGVEFGRLRAGVVAKAEIFPLTELAADNSVSWRPESTWNANTDAGWVSAAEASLPERTTIVEMSDAADLAIATVDDPDDNGRPGPNRGTAASVRLDEGWSVPVVIASGPGGDVIEKAASLGPGFVAVGYHVVRTEAGEDIYDPLISEYVDGGWKPIAMPDGAPEQTYLYNVATSGDGDVLAIGYSYAPGAEGDVFLARDSAGAWFVLPSPIQGQSTSILSESGSDTAIDLLVREDATWFRYEYDNGAFTQSAINFDGSGSPRPIGLVTLNDVSYLVGSTSGDRAAHLAVWELDGDAATSVEWPTPVSDIALELNDVIVSNDRLFVGGVSHGQNVVWELTINTV